MLICPICKNKLEYYPKENKNESNTYKCKCAHSFDVSKYGYVNLHLNNNSSGDNKEMVLARESFLSKGYFDRLANFISKLINELNIHSLIDLGCGEGYFDRAIKKNMDIEILGIDISKCAILEASKIRNKEGLDISYVIASNYNVSVADSSFDLVMSIFSPIDLNEIKRISKKYFLKVTPSVNHLIELKKMLYKDVYLNEEFDTEIDSFKLVRKENIKYKMLVKEMNELFKMTPYFYSTHNNFDISLNEDYVTFDFDVMLFKKE